MRVSTTSRTLVSGLSKGWPAKRLTSTSLEAPTPSANRPGASPATVMAAMDSTKALRVCTGTTATPRSMSVAIASAPSMAKASGPSTSAAQAAW